MLPAVFLAALLAAVSCVSQPDSGARPGGGFPVRELSRQEVVREGRVLGVVKELQIEHPAGDLRYYRVETSWGGWVGDVDTSGRFFRCEARS